MELMLQVQATEAGRGGGAAERSWGADPSPGLEDSVRPGPQRPRPGDRAWEPAVRGWTSPLLLPQLGLLRKVTLWEDSPSSPVGQPGSPPPRHLMACRCEHGGGRGDSEVARRAAGGLPKPHRQGSASLQPTVHGAAACLLLPRTPSSPVSPRPRGGLRRSPR